MTGIVLKSFFQDGIINLVFDYIAVITVRIDAMWVKRSTRREGNLSFQTDP